MELIPPLPLALLAGILILLTLMAVYLRPEYGLFLYGLALGFPDVALHLGTTINLRLDDAMLAIFLLRMAFWRPEPLGAGVRKVLTWQALFLGVCALSAILGFSSGHPPALYETIKMLGCGVILFVLPRIVRSRTRLGFLIAGLTCAGGALVLQIALRLGASRANASANFQEYKNAATFTTWNANTIGQAAMLCVFAAGIGSLTFSETRARKIFWIVLACGFALTPAMVFARGTSLSIAAGCFLFLLLSRHWKIAALLILLAASGVMYLRSANGSLAQSATRVDFATGEGFSHRYDRWEMAIDTIEERPLLGYGFGREWELLSGMGSEGRAHDAYLTVWLELGIGGLALFLAVIAQFMAEGFSLYKSPQSRLCGALLISLMAAMSMDSVALPTLYWEKLPTIALALGLAFAELCRNTAPQVAEEESVSGIERFAEPASRC